jgi:hypothetical protein
MTIVGLPSTSMVQCAPGRISLIFPFSSFSPAEATPDELWLQKNARSRPREIASNRAPRAHFLENGICEIPFRVSTAERLGSW